MDLYDRVIDRYQNLRNTGYRDPARAAAGRPGTVIVQAAGENPTCGDSLTVSLVIEEGSDGARRVTDGMHRGFGCSLCMASADVLIEALRGKTLEDALSFTAKDLGDAWGGLTPPRGRARCMDLSLRAAHSAVERASHA